MRNKWKKLAGVGMVERRRELAASSESSVLHRLSWQRRGPYLSQRRSWMLGGEILLYWDPEKYSRLRSRPPYFVL